MGVQTLTTQTTASTEVPRVPPGMYTPWQTIEATSIAIAGALGAIAALVAIINGIRGWFRKGPSAEVIAEIRDDVARLDSLCSQFKTKPELAEDAQAIKRDLEHEKTSRKADAEASAGKFREHDAAIVSLREGLARQQALIEGFSGAVGRIENAIDRMTERFDTRFDGLQRLVTGKS